jgi:cyanophycin synthetase
MVQQITTDSIRVNARDTDVFDIFDFKYYIGLNPYLNTRALVFNLALTDYRELLAIDDYISIISKRYPHLQEEKYESHAHLFARTVAEVGKLDMGLYFKEWSVTKYHRYFKIAVESLHAPTAKGVVFFVWDWFEAITVGHNIDFDQQLRELQSKFRQSVYGGPTVYALLQTAHNKGIPAFYLWEERLMQYGYGKKQVRGVATTFNCDSHLDSDFTTRKDDCKIFLKTLGFPVPEGDIVTTEREAFALAREITYPVAVKPVSGHKGIGVTPDVQSSTELENAFLRAVDAIPEGESKRIIVEKNIPGKDFRLLCVNGKFVAATERRPAYVVGDGYLTIEELIKEENRKTKRLDTPTSPMSQIIYDEEMELYLDEQGLSLDSVLKEDRVVYLRKVSNLSAGGESINATHLIHQDNINLAQDIAQHFQLTCLGIDIITTSLEKSWKSGSFAILEINAAPGIYMHLNPAVGDSVDVPAFILQTFFKSQKDARIPIITFNRISAQKLEEVIEHILSQHPDWTIGAVCRDGVFVNRSEKIFNKDYNSNVQRLLRNPKLDLLIAEYNESILEEDGMFYSGSNMVVLDNPTPTEMMLTQDVFDDSTVIIRKGDNVEIRRQNLVEEKTLNADESLSQVYLNWNLDYAIST